MGKPKAPKPADPVVTAGAQTGSNIGTAVAQSNLNNVNQVTPDGNLTYNQTGTYNYTDPLTGTVHAIPQFTATQTLSADQQALRDSSLGAQQNFADLAQQQSGQLKDVLGNPMNADGLPQRVGIDSVRQTNLQKIGNGPDLQNSVANAGGIQNSIGNAGNITKSYGTDFSEDRQKVEDALMARMNPNLQKDRENLEARLASQGIQIGSEAYKDAMGDFSQQSNDARYGAILNAGQEQTRLTQLEAQRAGFENSAQAQQYQQNATNASFANSAQAQQFTQNAQNAALNNQSLQQEYQNNVGAAGFNNQASVQETNADLARMQAADQSRNQALQERFAIRNQPINEVTALMSGSQVSQPNFVNTNNTQIANTDFAGIQANYDNQMMNRYQQQMSGWNNIAGGVLGLGANLLMSDKRTKKDIKKVGKTNDGQNIYSFRYKTGGPIQMGLMAQEVEKKKPDAVTNVGGIKMVDYGKAV